MTEGSRAKDAADAIPDAERASGQDLPGLEEQERRAMLTWMGEHLTEVRRSVYEQGVRWPLGIAFVLGLAAHVGGYLLRSEATTESLGLVADLLYALGWALWTGVVVAVFVQIIPDVKRRQLKRALDAYEATLGDDARAGNDRASEDDGASTAG